MFKLKSFETMDLRRKRIAIQSEHVNFIVKLKFYDIFVVKL